MDTGLVGESVPNNTETAITFTRVNSDTHGMWSVGSPTRLTFVEAARYFVVCSAFWNPGAVGYRRIRVRLNGGATILVGDSRMAVTTAGIGTDQAVPNTSFPFVVGDFIELMALHTQGAALTGFFALMVFRLAAPV